MGVGGRGEGRPEKCGAWKTRWRSDQLVLVSPGLSWFQCRTSCAPGNPSARGDSGWLVILHRRQQFQFWGRKACGYIGLGVGVWVAVNGLGVPFQGDGNVLRLDDADG